MHGNVQRLRTVADEVPEVADVAQREHFAQIAIAGERRAIGRRRGVRFAVRVEAPNREIFFDRS